MLKKLRHCLKKNAIAIFSILLMLTIAAMQKIQMDDFFESVSTRYIGNFPHNIRGIVNELEKAEKSILIVTDVPGYGMLSAPKEFEEYYSTLKNIIINKNKVNVQLLFYDKDAQINLINKQLYGKNIDEIYKKFRTTEELFGKSEPELSKLNEIKNNLPLQREEVIFTKFASTLVDMNQHIINSLDTLMHENNKLGQRSEQRSEQRVSEEDFIMHTWIIDEKCAVITFMLFHEKPTEISFRTKDQNLVKFIKDYANKKFEDGKKDW